MGQQEGRILYTPEGRQVSYFESTAERIISESGFNLGDVQIALQRFGENQLWIIKRSTPGDLVDNSLAFMSYGRVSPKNSIDRARARFKNNKNLYPGMFKGGIKDVILDMMKGMGEERAAAIEDLEEFMKSQGRSIDDPQMVFDEHYMPVGIAEWDEYLVSCVFDASREGGSESEESLRQPDVTVSMTLPGVYEGERQGGQKYIVEVMRNKQIYDQRNDPRIKGILFENEIEDANTQVAEYIFHDRKDAVGMFLNLTGIAAKGEEIRIT